MASVAVAPAATPVPSASTGATGATESRMKLVVPAGPALPATSVATAETLTVPLPSVVRSPARSTTAWAAPVPVTVLVTELLVPVKVTAMEALSSPETVTTPET